MIFVAFTLIVHVSYALFFDKLDLTSLDPTAQTSCGHVKGIYENQAFSYRGIPYALSPTGVRRWTPPIALTKTSGTCWNGTYDATEFKEQCFQLNEYKNGTSGSEDCLYLNVWTPSLNKTAHLPVMVWIHGGGLIHANGSYPGYSPTEELARDTGFVYVSMNYRLNAFGFLALDLLSQNSPTNTSGNYGILDQILVLQWVRENILNFGGDPTKVTIFGQSSGGTSVLAHLMSPLSRGLFHKAWMMSASPKMNINLHQASVDNMQFLNNSNCYNLSCLQQLSANQVLAAVPWADYPRWNQLDLMDLPKKDVFVGAILVVDGYVIPESPQDAWLNGNANDVPLMIGTMAQEQDTPDLASNIPWAEYETKVSERIGSFDKSLSKMALRMYPVGHETPTFQFSSMASDVRVSCPTDLLAMYASLNTDSSVYRYVSTARTSKPYNVFGNFYSSYSFHGLDSYAYFGSLSKSFSRPTVNDKLIENTIKREVMSFVKYGFPFTENWGTFPNVTANISNCTLVQKAYHSQECHFWLGNGFQEYAWIN